MQNAARGDGLLLLAWDRDGGGDVENRFVARLNREAALSASTLPSPARSCDYESVKRYFPVSAEGAEGDQAHCGTSLKVPLWEVPRRVPLPGQAQGALRL